MKKIIFVLFACLILLTGCSQKITEGEIYEKEFLPEETRTIIIPMIHTNGKSLYTTYVPVTHHYPDRWRISIKSIEKNDDGDYDTADYYTTEEVYNRRSSCTPASLHLLELSHKLAAYVFADTQKTGA